MITKLSEPIITFFNSTNRRNPEAFIETFKENAFVMDAGREFHGREQIKEWSKREFFDVNLILEPTNIVEGDTEIVVTARTDGDFDKSGLPDPLFLDFHFVANENKITNLNIIFFNTK